MTPLETRRDELMECFRYAYSKAEPHFETMDRIQKTYGNKVDTVKWPTISEISWPLTFTSIEEQLPFALQRLFPANKLFELIPFQEMDADKVDRVEDDLYYTITSLMKIAQAAQPSVKDCFKYAVGYGVVDTQIVTPPELVETTVFEGTKVIATNKRIGIGQPIKVPCYRYVSPVQVVPMPDGANVEGPNKASGHFWLDLYSEDDFMSLYDPVETLDGPSTKMMGDPKKIIDDARKTSFDARLMPIDILERLSGKKITATNNGDKNMPVQVPVLKCFFDHEQTWIANGTEVIWQLKDKYQTLRSDIIKWSAWPDGNEWFPLGITEASERLAWGVNVWYNGLVDLAMYMMNPTRVINTRLIDDQNIERGPKSDIKVNGDATQAIKYLELPQFPQQLLSMGDILAQGYAHSNAQTRNVQQGIAGLVRGGSNALEMMLSSQTGRQYLAVVMMQTGAYLPIIEKTLIKKQLLATDAGSKIIKTVYDKTTSKKKFVEQSITVDDLRSLYRVEINPPEQKFNDMLEFNKRTAYFDRAMQNQEYFDVRKLFIELADDEKLVRRTMLPESVVKQRQEQMAQAKIEAAQQGQFGPQSLTQPNGQQAMQGVGMEVA